MSLQVSFSLLHLHVSQAWSLLKATMDTVVVWALWSWLTPLPWFKLPCCSSFWWVLFNLSRKHFLNVGKERRLSRYVILTRNQKLIIWEFDSRSKSRIEYNDSLSTLQGYCTLVSQSIYVVRIVACAHETSHWEKLNCSSSRARKVKFSFSAKVRDW